MENDTPSPEIENELRRHIKSLIIFETKHISPYRDGMTNVIVSIPNLTALIAKFVTRSNRKAVEAELRALKVKVQQENKAAQDWYADDGGNNGWWAKGHWKASNQTCAVIDARISQLEAEDK